MTTLYRFTVLADFPDGTDALVAEKEIAAAVDSYLKDRRMNHVTTLASTTPGVTVLDVMASVGAIGSHTV